MSVVLALQSALPARHPEPTECSRWLYAGEDAEWTLSARTGPLAGLERVNTGPLLEDAAERLRDPYIDWIGELSQQNASLEWWASELAAKNPFARFFPRLCALLAARRAIDEGLDDALVVCSTPAVLESLRAAVPDAQVLEGSDATLGEGRLKRAARRGIDAWSRFAPGPCSTRRGGSRRGRSSPSTTATPTAAGRLTVSASSAASRSPVRTRRCCSPGSTTAASERTAAISDPHFGRLPQLLREQGQEVAFVPRVITPASFGPTVRDLVSTGERFLFPDSWTDAGDWSDAERRAREFSPAIPEGSELLGTPVAGLAREHVAEYALQQQVPIAQDALVKNLVAGGVRPERVILPFEGHSWEQALTHAVHEQMPDTAVIGWDNVNFSRFALSLYPARSEIGLRPLPDRVVTSGETFREILTREGFPAERVRVGCALRHEGIHELPSAGKRPDGAPIRVLVATSIDPAQSAELVAKALAAFGDDERFELTVKCHPAVDARRVRAWADELAPGGRATFSEQPIDELLTASDAMLYTYSVVCYEALARGVAAVFVKSDTFIDLDQLEPFPELGRQARTPAELREQVLAAAELPGPERERWRERAKEAVAAALAPSTGDCTRPFLEP